MFHERVFHVEIDGANFALTTPLPFPFYKGRGVWAVSRTPRVLLRDENLIACTEQIQHVTQSWNIIIVFLLPSTSGRPVAAILTLF